MITFILDLLVAVLIYLITASDLGMIWGIVCGIGAGLITQIAISLILRRFVNKENARIQQDMELAQAKIQRRIQQFQQRPVGSPKTMQQLLEKEQFDAMRQALKTTDELKKFYPWSILMKRQVATMKMALHYQLKEFDQADALMKKVLLFDVRTLAMKMARMYKHNDPKLDKLYKRKGAKYKGEDRAFIASVYAWILVKKGEYDKALAVLTEAKKKTDNAIIQENWERLANAKYKHYSNSNFGDLWYSLYLEEPKVKVQRVNQRQF